jgi:DNA-binding winged helix-turn-helix (wHTH) protein
MSLATIDHVRPSTTTRLAAVEAAPTVTPPPADAGTPRLRAIPTGTEARGFVLYVGVDEFKAAAAGVDLSQLVAALKQLTTDLVPTAQTHAAVALAPAGAGGRDVDVVRLALQDPSALARHRHQEPEFEEPEHRIGVIIDLTRKQVSLDGQPAGLTYKEFELLQYLVLREGRTIHRSELIDGLWDADSAEEAPNERTIDVHVRRLRSKLGGYEDIVRTVRGVGYRFDRHPDVSVRHTSTPSPDLF